jgi:hypothetical protein
LEIVYKEKHNLQKYSGKVIEKVIEIIKMKRKREKNERNDNAKYCKTWPQNYFFKNAKVAFSICDGNILNNL